ncbi:CDK-activating kinase assembly factor MAT1 [Methanobrevibacter thaueri]|uniref:Uncharacterized protein n=1 Tax=Methanobrevibacter thaueri TaxID=190975 RepID=A0A315XQ15_9EURY|nr:hypothetical protein [Methanobrevibacter thaueri]PWB88004.1 hypothetical protein MBBTH_05910 [Methanobrevibacter thaueri]
MKHELFEVGLYDYSDLDRRLNKPVKWTSDDLRQIAENYRGGIPLTSEHDKVYIGIGNNIVFEEDKGKLFIDLPDELDMKGKGLSPKVDVLLKDNGDSFGIDTMSLIDVGVTKNPRKMTLLNSEITGETGEAGETANPEPPEVENQDANVTTNLLLEKLKGKDAEIGKLQDEITTLKKESKKYDKIKKSIEENKEFINNKEDILKELSELRKHENERKIKEYEAKYNFNYNENAQDKEIIDKLLTGDVDMELMEKLAERRIKIEATNDISTPGGRNPQNSSDIGETGSAGDENAPSFTTREEYNRILKDMGFNRTKI